MESKQTAVEWLKSNLPSLFIDDSGHYQELFKHAIQMEREQIQDAWISAWQDSMLEPLDRRFYEDLAEEYYTDIYGKQ